jgi:hypothetical protein
MNDDLSEEGQRSPERTNPQAYPGSTPPPQYQNYPNYPPVQYIQVPVPAGVPNAGGATASMVLGIISMFLCCYGWITGIIAIALAASAMKKISSSGGQYGGRGMAVAGLVLGIISVVVYLPLMALWLAGIVAAPATP